MAAPVSKSAVMFEDVSQSSEMAVTRTRYRSPHDTPVIWQLADCAVQDKMVPFPSVAIAL